jgi:hypothetical protein
LLAEACAEAAACWALVEALSAREAAASAWLAALVARSAGSGPEEQPPISESAKAAPPTNPSSFDVFPINPSILFLLDRASFVARQFAASNHRESTSESYRNDNGR